MVEKLLGRKADKKNSRIHTSKKWMRQAFAIQSLAKACSETFSQVNRFGSAQINQILHEMSFIADQNLFPTLVSNFLFFFFFRARK
jgi:hypothetical protein